MAPHARPFAEMEEWYRAYDRFMRLVRDPRHQLRFALRPGDLVLYDNHRMLHARSGFRGARWVRGVYFDEPATHATPLRRTGIARGLCAPMWRPPGPQNSLADHQASRIVSMRSARRMPSTQNPAPSGLAEDRVAMELPVLAGTIQRNHE